MTNRSYWLRFIALCGATCVAPAVAGCSGDSLGKEEAANTSVDALTGTWDVIGSEVDGATRTGSLVIAPDALTVTFGDYVLTFHDGAPSGGATWDDKSSAQASRITIPTTHGASSVRTGIIPLSIGGAWTFADAKHPGSGCTATLNDDGFAGACNGVQVQPDFDEFYATHPFPAYWDQAASGAWDAAYSAFVRNHIVPGANGEMVGTRLRTFPSSFGDLGGEWELVGNGGAYCRATLRDQTFTSTCSGIFGDYSDSDANGTLTIHFATGLAAGSTDKGIELTARRVHR